VFLTIKQLELQHVNLIPYAFRSSNPLLNIFHHSVSPINIIARNSFGQKRG